MGYGPAPRPTLKRPYAILVRLMGPATNTVDLISWFIFQLTWLRLAIRHFDPPLFLVTSSVFLYVAIYHQILVLNEYIKHPFFSVYHSPLLYTYTSSASQWHNNKDARVKTQERRKTQEDFFRKIFTSHFIARVRKGCWRVCMWEDAGDQT